MIITLLVSLVLLALSAAFSGLNIGLMTLSPTDLKRKAEHGDKNAAILYPVRQNGNYLIVCLLLGNVAVISALSLVLESVTSGILAGLLTTALVTIFGEILPQAFFSRNAMAISVRFVWLLKIVFVVLWPVAKPASIALDNWLGEELPTIHTKDELSRIVEEHSQHHDSPIDADESRIVAGALTFSDLKASDIMTPIEQAVMLDDDLILDSRSIVQIRNSKHTRFPVWDRDEKRMVGLLHIKDLIGAGLDKPVSHYMRPKLHEIGENTRLDTVLSRFTQTKSHMFVVENDVRDIVGIITLEDVIEQIIGQDIEDEHDV